MRIQTALCVFVWNIVYLCGWLQKATLSELIYMADNMAFLPYQVQDEPLYTIHQIDIIISVSGSNFLQSYKEVTGSLFLCQNEVIIAFPLCPWWRVVGWGQYQLIFVFSRLFVSSFCLPIVLTVNMPFSPIQGWSLPLFFKTSLSTILFLSVFFSLFHVLLVNLITLIR